MSETFSGYSHSDHGAEMAAQRIVIAALTNGNLRLPLFAADEAKQAGQFLAEMTKALSEELRKKPA
jgi:hypothetical protein